MSDGNRHHFKTNKGNYDVKVTTKRLVCFLNYPECAECNIRGSIFKLQRHSRDLKAISPHLNFYAVKHGREILMTVDHIIPVSKGGTDAWENLQTMCQDCNRRKADNYEEE